MNLIADKLANSTTERHGKLSSVLQPDKENPVFDFECEHNLQKHQLTIILPKNLET